MTCRFHKALRVAIAASACLLTLSSVCRAQWIASCRPSLPSHTAYSRIMPATVYYGPSLSYAPTTTYRPLWQPAPVVAYTPITSYSAPVVYQAPHQASYQAAYPPSYPAMTSGTTTYRISNDSSDLSPIQQPQMPVQGPQDTRAVPTSTYGGANEVIGVAEVGGYLYRVWKDGNAERYQEREGWEKLLPHSFGPSP